MTRFAEALARRQLPGHCGPTSLSTGLFLLGKEATPRALARAAGVAHTVYLDGADEDALIRAAEAFGATATRLGAAGKRRGTGFAKALQAHLESGLTAVLCVDGYHHWIAAVGFIEGKFIVRDPNGAEMFSRYGQRRLVRRAYAVEEDSYFALLLGLPAGEAPRFRFNRDFLRLAENGSEETAEQMAEDLTDMVVRASRGAGDGEGDGRPLAVVLAELEETVVGTLLHWVRMDCAKVSAREARRLYRDYQTMAAATGLLWPDGADRGALAAQLTAVLVTYAWVGAL